MALKPSFNRDEINRHCDRFLESVENRQVKAFAHMGERCVLKAVLSGTYVDQTGNLRASIGYTVFKDGQAVLSQYQETGEANAATKARQLAENVAKQYPKGILLVVVAGMNYAIYVEAKGLDVLTSAEQLAQQELPRMLSDLTENINQMFE